MKTPYFVVELYHIFDGGISSIGFPHWSINKKEGCEKNHFNRFLKSVFWHCPSSWQTDKEPLSSSSFLYPTLCCLSFLARVTIFYLLSEECQETLHTMWKICCWVVWAGIRLHWACERERSLLEREANFQVPRWSLTLLPLTQLPWSLLGGEANVGQWSD